MNIVDLKDYNAVHQKDRFNFKPWIGLEYIILVLAALIVFFPLLVVFFTSFKTDAEYTTTSVFQMPANFFYFGNYYKAFIQGKFFFAFMNSFIIVITGVIANVLCGAMTVYCMARFEFKLKKVINGIIMLSAIVPQICLQVSIYTILKTLGVIGTYIAPLLLYSVIDMISFMIYIQFIDKIHVSLDESAMLDGASYFRIFWSIILPLLKPATATIIILRAITIYNDLFTQVLYMTRGDLQTVTTALITFNGTLGSSQNLLSAGLIMVMIPTVILFLALQKNIFSGITVGAIKE
jgi:raffinose/stachyose/melibiose transport system permease protein